MLALTVPDIGYDPSNFIESALSVVAGHVAPLFGFSVAFVILVASVSWLVWAFRNR